VEIGGSTHPAQLGHHTVLTVSERTWNDFYRDLGLPDEYLVDGADRISDPDGQGPDIWFRVEPDAKTVKNRLAHCQRKGTGSTTTRSG
jgi:hypothetical protein